MRLASYLCGAICAEAGNDPQATQVCNPPMVHSLATPILPDGPPSVLERVAAVARGDGEVAVYDLDAGGKFARRGTRGGGARLSSAPIFSSRCHGAAVNCV